MRLVVMLGLVILLAGCAGPAVILHPIDQTDIIAIREGDDFTAPKDGFFLSSLYVQEVMDAKVER